MNATTSIDRVRRFFPQENEIPAELRLLCEFNDGVETFYGGEFRILPDAYLEFDILEPSFGSNKQAARMIVPFGRTSDGSLFVLWLVNQVTPDKAPVGTLGSEGENAILAEDIRSFIELLANCDANLPEYGASGDASRLYSHTDDSGFTGWVQNTFKITYIRPTSEIVAAAKAKHPGFEDWVNAECEKGASAE
jgi:hypothetical protein